MRRRALAVSIGLVLALTAGAGTALAGGWAITSVDSAPQEFVAGQTYDVEYSVLQHGIHPVTANGTAMQLVNETTGQSLTFPGVPNRATGRQTATITVPEAGDWSWTVSSAFGEQELGVLRVAAADDGASLWTSTAARMTLTAATVVLAVLLILQAVQLRRFSLREGLAQPAPAGAGD